MGNIFSDYYRDLRRQKKKPSTMGPEIIVISGFRNNGGQKSADLVISEPRITALPTSQNWDYLSFGYSCYLVQYQVSHVTTAYSVPGTIPVCCIRHPSPTTKNHYCCHTTAHRACLFFFFFNHPADVVCETELRPHTNVTAPPPPP